nr:MAG TPA: hypothetical protein [Caudoviricetes sp.]
MIFIQFSLVISISTSNFGTKIVLINRITNRNV